ncbi:DUF4407 domain-containing protein [Nocardia harenae]|uniref:DUF4407 domain-containing protein n=1 Tax=Nocardia harenae TaxID=358707 RepID=UPI0008325C1F|nr:DUF4407 domain-containing protein [Nocardia harenae]
MTVTGLFTRLGGAPADAPALPHERSGYVTTGAAVLGFALVAGGVTAAATIPALPLAGAIVASAAATVFAALVGRTGATARPGRMPDPLGTAGRALLAVLTGVVVAELAATVLFAGAVDRTLDDRAHAAAEAGPAVTAARAELELARAERTALDAAIATARADIDTALVTARCEFNPGPGCPDTRITGVPGDGPEARTANELLADARARLATAEQRAPALDQRVRTAEQELGATAAATGTDRGLGARWSAMNESAALLPRLLGLLVFVALALLPLLLRRWRGDTTFDRRIAADLVRDRAEREADAAIAVQRARTRTETERVRAEQELTAAELVAEADTAIDRERQRTRVIAAIGGLEIGITEPSPQEAGAELALPGNPEGPAALPAARTVEPVRATDLPARVDPDAVRLPVLGTVPFSGTAVRLFRPFVPGVVADAIGTAAQPLRIAVRALEEREEITFTVRRTRTVRVGAVLDIEPEHPVVATVPPPDISLRKTAARHEPDSAAGAGYPAEPDAVAAAQRRALPSR